MRPRKIVYCSKAVPTGVRCSGGYSWGIECEHSETGCLRDCKPTCPGFKPIGKPPKEQKRSTGCGHCGKSSTQTSYPSKGIWQK